MNVKRHSFVVYPWQFNAVRALMVFDVASQPRVNRDTSHGLMVLTSFEIRAPNRPLERKISTVRTKSLPFDFLVGKVGCNRQGYHVRVRNMQNLGQLGYKSDIKILVIEQNSHGANILCSW